MIRWLHTAPHSLPAALAGLAGVLALIASTPRQASPTARPRRRTARRRRGRCARRLRQLRPDPSDRRAHRRASRNGAAATRSSCRPAMSSIAAPGSSRAGSPDASRKRGAAGGWPRRRPDRQPRGDESARAISATSRTRPTHRSRTTDPKIAASAPTTSMSRPRRAAAARAIRSPRETNGWQRIRRASSSTSTRSARAASTANGSARTRSSRQCNARHSCTRAFVPICQARSTMSIASPPATSPPGTTPARCWCKRSSYRHSARCGKQSRPRSTEIERIAAAIKAKTPLEDFVTREFVDRLQTLLQIDKLSLVAGEGPLWFRGLRAVAGDAWRTTRRSPRC